MKKQFATLLIALTPTLTFAQAGPKWATGGNSISNGDFFGTTNNFDLQFKVNNALKMKLDVNGDLNLNNLAGSGSRVLMTDLNGKIISLPAGMSGQFLQGNGTWGSLPGGATSWQLVGSNLISTNTGNVGIGTNNPLYKLTVVGNADITGNLLVGGGVITTNSLNTTVKLNAGDVDVTNNLNVTGISNLNGNANFNGNTNFNGALNSAPLGNGTGYQPVFVGPTGQLITLQGPGGPPNFPTNACQPTNPFWQVGGNFLLPLALAGQAAGTCDNTDFILKSNNVNRQFLKTDGSISFGANIPSFSGGKEYMFKGGVVKLSGSNSYGGAQIVFDTPGSNFPGDWCIEHVWSIGESYPGLNFRKPDTNPLNSVLNNILFLANSGVVGIATNKPTAQLTVAMPLQNALALSLIANGNVNNSDYFNVYGSGYTEIKVYNPLTMPAPPGGSPRAFAIKDIANNKDLFVVNATGKAYAREIEINLATTFPDYVFAKDYKLKPLSEVDTFIKQNEHLPNFEKGTYYEKNGINVTDLILKQQQTIEELMLYNIDLEKRLKALEGKK